MMQKANDGVGGEETTVVFGPSFMFRRASMTKVAAMALE